MSQWTERRQLSVLSVLGDEVTDHFPAEISWKARVSLALTYQCLVSFEAQGFVYSAWTTDSIGRQRRVYSLTEPGRKHLNKLMEPFNAHR